MGVPSSPGQAPPRKASHSIAFYFGTGLIVPVTCLLVLWGLVTGAVLSGTLVVSANISYTCSVTPIKFRARPHWITSS